MWKRLDLLRKQKESHLIPLWSKLDRLLLWHMKRDDTTFGFVFFHFSMNALFEPPAIEEVAATRWQQSLLINKETAALREHFSCSKNTLSSSFPQLNVCYQSNMATDISHLCTVGA